jgi:hypothetical protein
MFKCCQIIAILGILPLDVGALKNVFLCLLLEISHTFITEWFLKPYLKSPPM